MAHARRRLVRGLAGALALALAGILSVSVGPALAGDVGSSRSPVGDWRIKTLGVVQTVTFDEDGTVYGESGCNRFAGTYEVDRGMLTIGPLATTLMMCAEPIMDAEQIFLTKLQAVVAYTATKARLRLFTPKDLMVLRAVT